MILSTMMHPPSLHRPSPDYLIAHGHDNVHDNVHSHNNNINNININNHNHTSTNHPPRRLTVPMASAPAIPTRRLSAVTQGRGDPASPARRISLGDAAGSLERGAARPSLLRNDHQDQDDYDHEDDCDDVSLVVDSSSHERSHGHSHGRSDSVFDALFLDGPHAVSHGSGNDVDVDGMSEASLAGSTSKRTGPQQQQQYHPCFERKSSQQSRKQSWIISDWDEIEQTTESRGRHCEDDNGDGDGSLCPRDASDDVFYRILDDDDDDYDCDFDCDYDDYDCDDDIHRGRFGRTSGSSSHPQESACLRKSLHQIMMEEEVSFQRSLVWHSSDKESFD